MRRTTGSTLPEIDAIDSSPGFAGSETGGRGGGVDLDQNLLATAALPRPAVLRGLNPRVVPAKAETHSPRPLLLEKKDVTTGA